MAAVRVCTLNNIASLPLAAAFPPAHPPATQTIASTWQLTEPMTRLPCSSRVSFFSSRMFVVASWLAKKSMEKTFYSHSHRHIRHHKLSVTIMESERQKEYKQTTAAWSCGWPCFKKHIHYPIHLPELGDDSTAKSTRAAVDNNTGSHGWFVWGRLLVDEMRKVGDKVGMKKERAAAL